MTKLKSKKMTKSTFAVIIMAIAMVALLAFGGTYAYFTASASGASLNKTATLGKIALDEATTVLEATVTTNVLPTEKVFGENGATLTIADKSNRISYIFIEVSATVDTANADPAAIQLEGTIGEGSVDDNVYYIKTTDATMGKDIDVEGINFTIPANWGNDYQEATITVTFTIKSIQEEGFDSAADAYAMWSENGTKIA